MITEARIKAQHKDLEDNSARKIVLHEVITILRASWIYPVVSESCGVDWRWDLSSWTSSLDSTWYYKNKREADRFEDDFRQERARIYQQSPEKGWVPSSWAGALGAAPHEPYSDFGDM